MLQVRDFHIAKREEDIGSYAGYIGSAFMFGRTLTSAFWGVVADCYGRKPVIIFGTSIVYAYAAEIFREEYQALGMSTISSAWGIGLIIGPALGGFLAQPAEKYPDLFTKGSLFGRYFALLLFRIITSSSVC
nr:protein ZINC INDUCED FACILITATOR 1-like [Solanum lycopersicum]